MDDKYLVFKRDEFIERHGTSKVVEALDDAVVIRTRDIFAPGVLHTYSAAVQTAIEVIQGTDAQLSSLWITDLEKVRDYFHDRAVEADEVQTKRFPTP